MPPTYIGETGRTLATRMKDHLNLRNPLTAVAEHCAHKHHKITKDSVEVVAREDIYACLSRPAADGRPAGCVCLCHRAASFIYFGEVLRCPHKRIVAITKVYIARNTIHMEIIRFHTN